MKAFIKKWKGRIKRRLPALGVLFLTVLLIWLAFGKSFRSLLPLIREGNRDAIVTYLSGEDAVMGMVSVVLLSAIQVVSIIMPCMAIHIAAGVLYNWYKAFFLCFTGFVGGNMAVFWFVRHLGKKTPYNVKLGSVGTKIFEVLSVTPPMFMVSVAFMIPGVPNGIVPYIAAKTRMTQKEYFISTSAGCWMQILASCMAGSFLIRGNIMFSVIAICVQWLILGLVIVQRNWIMDLFRPTAEAAGHSEGPALSEFFEITEEEDPEETEEGAEESPADADGKNPEEKQERAEEAPADADGKDPEGTEEKAAESPADAKDPSEQSAAEAGGPEDNDRTSA